MIKIRRAEDRGLAEHGWLTSRHTFSFAGYYDPDQLGFRGLRVINEDWIQPGRGFGTHPHRDMEILSFVLDGALEHRDSMGTGSVIRPFEVQRMSAGTGVTHSEFNASKTEPVHLLQIWIEPRQAGIAPSYEQKAFPREEQLGRLRVVASPDARDGSVKIHSDVSILSGSFESGQTAAWTQSRGRHGWIQIANGRIELGGEELCAGDGAAISDMTTLQIVAIEPSDVLFFDLA